MDDKKPKKQIVFTLDETAEKDFKKMKYIFNFDNDLLVFQEALNYLSKVVEFAEKGAPIIVPALRKKAGKYYPLVDSKERVVYMELNQDILERLKYWNQMQSTLEDITDKED